MRKFKLRLLTGLLGVLLIVGILGGCSAVIKDPVVATVGDIDIHYSDFAKEFNNWMYYAYNNYGLSGFSSVEELEDFQDSIMQNLLSTEAQNYNAKLNNISLTPEEEAEAVKSAEAAMEQEIASYNKDVDESITDQAKIREESLKLLVADLEANESSYDALYQDKLTAYRESMMRTKLKDMLTADINVTEADAKSWFDTQIASQKEAVAADPAKYYDLRTSFDTNGGVPPLVTPEGYIRVKHILVEDDATADTVLALVKEGLFEFDILAENYGTDPGMTREPYKSQGYLLSKETASNYYPEFAEVALALKEVGDVSGKVPSQAGIHIIMLVEKVEAKELTFDEVKDVVTKTLLDTKKSEAYQTKIDEWLAQKYVKPMHARIREVGKSLIY